MINVLLRRGRSVWGIAFSIVIHRYQNNDKDAFYLFFDSVTASVMELFINLARLHLHTNKDKELHPRTATYPNPVLKLCSVIDFFSPISLQRSLSRNIPHFRQTSVKCQTVDIQTITRKGRVRCCFKRTLWANVVGASVCIFLHVCCHYYTWNLACVCQQNNASSCVWHHSSTHMCVHVCAWQKGLEDLK